MSSNQWRSPRFNVYGNHWVSFVGADTLHEVPDNVAVIVVNGNGRSNPVELYNRFVNVTFLELPSPRDGWHAREIVTEAMMYQILDFCRKNADVGIVVQCSAGEQRSVAVARFIEDTLGRTMEFELPGCKGNMTYMDTNVYDFLCIKQRRAHLIEKRALNVIDDVP